MKAFLAGLGIGAAVGVLIAPKSGEETRRELLDMANERYEGARQRIDNTISTAKEQVNDRISEAKEKISDAADQLSDTKDRLVRKAERQYHAVMDRSILSILNDWTEERLIEINGIGPVLAGKIIQNRPYRAESDLVESKILPPSAIEALRKAS